MADVIDRAAGYAAAEIQNGIKQAQSGVKPEKQSLFECEDCEEPIPEARRKAVPGCTRCVVCQEKAEKERQEI